MRRIRVGVACLVAVFVASAVGATSASAEAPEFGHCEKTAVKNAGEYTNSLCNKKEGDDDGPYEFTPGAVKTGFTLSSVQAALATEGAHHEMLCKGGLTGGGEYTSATTVGNVVLKFTGCKAETLFECQEFETVKLSGELQLQVKGSDAAYVLLDLKPQAGKQWSEAFCGPVTEKVRGSVLAKLRVGSLKGKKWELAGFDGRQKPEEYETESGEKVKAVLESENSAGKKFEPASLQDAYNLTDEEELVLK
jgi:hypothetical protein